MSVKNGFLIYPRQENNTIPPKERLASFAEFHTPLSEEQRLAQASRCMHCGVPFCQSAMTLGGMVTGCPLHNLIPEWNEEIAAGNDQYALARLLKTNPLPEFTSRVCPALCEKACINGLDGEPTTVHDNEFYIIETGFEKGWMQPKVPETRSGRKAAVIGSGPAGLAAAHLLNQRGHEVTVFEKEDRPGGLLMYGIPNMKLDKNIVKRRIDLMEKEGIRFICSKEAGKDISYDQLADEFDAVILAAGSKTPRPLGVDAAGVSGIYYAVDFLSDATRALLEGHPASITAEDKHVVIVGGGDTGNDCIGTSLRQHAASVVQLEMMPEPPETRAAGNPWPEWPKVKKTDYGQQEAIEVFGKDPRLFSTTVKSIIAEDGQIKKVEIVSLDSKMQPIEGSEQILDCDLLLIAAGFIGIPDSLKEAFSLPATRRNTVDVSFDNMAVNDHGLFACGDCRRGQSLVVWAIAEGKECARQADEWLMGYSNIE